MTDLTFTTVTRRCYCSACQMVQPSARNTYTDHIPSRALTVRENHALTLALLHPPRQVTA